MKDGSRNYTLVKFNTLIVTLSWTLDNSKRTFLFETTNYKVRLLFIRLFVGLFILHRLPLIYLDRFNGEILCKIYKEEYNLRCKNYL